MVVCSLARDTLVENLLSPTSLKVQKSPKCKAGRAVAAKDTTGRMRRTLPRELVNKRTTPIHLYYHEEELTTYNTLSLARSQ